MLHDSLVRFFFGVNGFNITGSEAQNSFYKERHLLKAQHKSANAEAAEHTHISNASQLSSSIILVGI